MKNRYIAILFVVVVAAAVCVAGCTGGSSTTSPTANPTGNPGSGTVQPTSQPQSSGPEIKMYNDGQYNWVEYNMKMSRHDDDWTKVRYDLTMEDYRGTPVKHIKTTQTLMGYPVSSDVYISTATGKAIAAKVTAIGTTTEIDAANLSSYDGADPAASTDAFMSTGGYSEYKYKGSSPDVVIVNGKTYTCTKYTWWKSYSDDGSSRVEVWIDGSVPVPVKMVTYYKNEADSQMELLGWG
ncbi:MAG: hypothetical protein A4E28_03088 [Methanocella sp. PtaU1.Bin125]|nr:MAG: hypothetical protein A4E28_03088 [Methanocella sp. PtaU1.Bin125]